MKNIKKWDMMHVNVGTRIAPLSTQISSVLLRDPLDRRLSRKLQLETQKRQDLSEKEKKKKFKVYYSNLTKRNEKTKKENEQVLYILRNSKCRIFLV